MNQFSTFDPKEFTITPLGAAIVEALPDREKVKRIQQTFKRNGKVPTSAIFKTDSEIEAFYGKEGGR
jgi:hypothetical protein